MPTKEPTVEVWLKSRTSWMATVCFSTTWTTKHETITWPITLYNWESTNQRWPRRMTWARPMPSTPWNIWIKNSWCLTQAMPLVWSTTSSQPIWGRTPRTKPCSRKWTLLASTISIMPCFKVSMEAWITGALPVKASSAIASRISPQWWTLTYLTRTMPARFSNRSMVVEYQRLSPTLTQ